MWTIPLCRRVLTRRIRISIWQTDLRRANTATGGSRPALRFLEARHRVAECAQALQWIGHFEQVLALGIAQGQEFGESETHPARILVVFARTIAPRQSGLLGEPLQYRGQQGELDRHRHAGFVRPVAHVADDETVAADAG